MNKILLILGLSLLASLRLYAQPVFSFNANPVDSLTSGLIDENEKMRGYIINNTANPLVLNWQLVTDSGHRPLGWMLVGICDNWYCRGAFVDSLEDGHKIQFTDTIYAGDSSIIELHVYVTPSMPDGVGIFKLKVYDALQTQVDTFTFRLCKNMSCGTPTGINQVAQEDMILTLFPNPVRDNVTVSLNRQQKAAALHLYDHTGRLLEQYKPEGNQQTIDMQAFPPGIYFIRLYSKDGGVTQGKIVKW